MKEEIGTELNKQHYESQPNLYENYCNILNDKLYNTCL